MDNFSWSNIVNGFLLGGLGAGLFGILVSILVRNRRAFEYFLPATITFLTLFILWIWLAIHG